MRERARFLDSLARSLRAGGRNPERIVAEVEDHLLSAIERLETSGWDPERAEREAVEALGRPEELARTYLAEVPPPDGLLLRLSRLGLVVLSSANFLGAALIAGIWASGGVHPDVPLVGFLLKMAACLLVMAVGAAAILREWSGDRRHDGSLVLGGLALLGLGVAGALWTSWLALLTGDAEYYLILISLLHAAQGALTAAVSFVRQRRFSRL